MSWSKLQEKYQVSWDKVCTAVRGKKRPGNTQFQQKSMKSENQGNLQHPKNRGQKSGSSSQAWTSRPVIFQELPTNFNPFRATQRGYHEQLS